MAIWVASTNNNFMNEYESKNNSLILPVVFGIYLTKIRIVESYSNSYCFALFLETGFYFVAQPIAAVLFYIPTNSAQGGLHHGQYS